MAGEAFEVFELGRVSLTAGIHQQPLVVESRRVKVSSWWFCFGRLRRVAEVGMVWVMLAVWLQWFPAACFQKRQKEISF